MNMKVKYIIGAVLILALGYEIYRIEKQLSVVTLEIRKTDRATVTIPSLAPASTFDNTDLFIVADGGTVSRKLAGSQITGAIGDTATTLRSEMGTGSGVVDTTGLPVANQFTYFTAANKIASSSNLTRASNGVVSYTGVGFVFNDSAYIDYEPDGFMEWVGKSKTGALFSDSLAPAGYGLTMPLPRITEALRDKDGEIKWWLSDSTYTYRLDTLAPAEMVRTLVASAEQDKRYILDLFIMVTVLIIIMAVSCGFIIAVTVKMLRK